MDLSSVEPDEYVGNPEALLPELREKINESRKARQKREKDWYIQREFYRGNQYCTYVENAGIADLPNTKRKPRLINNLCRPSVETKLSYLLRQSPVFDVAAKTGDPEDQNASMIGRTVLYHYWQLLNCQKKLKDAGLNAFIMGIGLWKVGWDPRSGPTVPIIERVPVEPELTPEMMEQAMMGLLPPEAMAPQLVEMQTGEQIAGDVRIDLVSPFEFLPDPGALSLDDAQWVFHTTMRPVHEMRALYPEHAEKIVASDSESEGGFEKRALANWKQGTGRGKLERCQVYEYWQRKTEQHPEGLHVVMIKDLILEAGPTPPGYDEIPFADLRDLDVPGEFWPDATLHDAIPLQKEHNKRLSQAVDIANKFKTVWTAPIGSIDETQINDEDGQIIEHQPGQAPTAHAPPPLPDSLVQILSFSRDAIEQVTGATSALKGDVKGEVRSGRQVAYLGQYAEGRMGLSAMNMAAFLERAGKLILMQVSENVTEPRVARMVGKNRSMEVKSFMGADLRGQTDVVVQPGTLLSFSKSERFNMLKEMNQAGVIGPDKFLELMEMEDFSSALEDVAQDRNNAQRENEEWRSGVFDSQPRNFENHQIHLSQHNSFRKSDAYRMLDPQAQMLVDQHCAVHEQALIPPPMPMAPGKDGPGGPPSPGQMVDDEAAKQGGQEIAEGLPPPPPVADPGNPATA